MIYIKRNPALIPPKILDKAQEAQAELEKMPEEERAAFIRRKSRIWGEFKPYLMRMSFDKCWYSESPEVQSFLDVDHYRPKLKAIRSENEEDKGYEWLAFSWENFRLSAERSNRLSTNEESDETEGKGNWFPLLENSPKATWDNRCETIERPILLDPTKRSDVDLIDVNSDGRMEKSFVCVGSSCQRVARSIELYGLNLPRLVAARKMVMREIQDLYDTLSDMIDAANEHQTAADSLPIERQVEQIRRTTMPQKAYSKAARAKLRQLGMAELCMQPEEHA